MIDYTALIRTHQASVAKPTPVVAKNTVTPTANDKALESFVATLKNATCKIKYRKADRSLVDMEITLRESLIPDTSKGTARVMPNGMFSVWSVDRHAWRSLKYSSIEEIVSTTSETVTQAANSATQTLILSHAQQIALNHFISETVRPTMKSANKTMTLEFRATASGYDVTEKNTGLAIDL